MRAEKRSGCAKGVRLEVAGKLKKAGGGGQEEEGWKKGIVVARE